MVELACNHCDNEWDYTGKKPAGAYTNCPECYYKVQIVAPEADS